MKPKIPTSLAIVLFLALGLVVSLVAVSRQQQLQQMAAPDVTSISLTTTTPNVAVNQTFSVDVMINTGANQTVGSDLYFKYDSTILQAVSITPGNFLPNAGETNKSINPTTGIIQSSIFLPVGTTAVSGTGKLATLTFVALKTGTATISLQPNSLVAGAGATEGQNILPAGSTTPVNITIANVPIPNPAQTTLSLIPPTFKSPPQPGEEFDVAISIDTSTNTALGADIHHTFDNKVFEIVSITPGSFFTNPQVLGTTIDNANGTAFFAISVPLPPAGTPRSGTGILANIKVRAKNPGIGQINFAPQTQVAGALEQEGQNILKQTTGTTITVGTSTTTPTPTATPTGTSTEHPINWKTSTVELSASDFYLIANGKKFYPQGPVTVHSDPGNANYTSLEVSWTDALDIPMRFYIYFKRGALDWWSYEMRTYNGTVPGDWIYYPGAFNAQTGKPQVLPEFTYYSPDNGQVYFKNLSIQAFTQLSSPIPGDINLDQCVNLLDYTILFQNFGLGCNN